jgi:hypothetical protein
MVPFAFRKWEGSLLSKYGSFWTKETYVEGQNESNRLACIENYCKPHQIWRNQEEKTNIASLSSLSTPRRDNPPQLTSGHVGYLKASGKREEEEIAKQKNRS